MRVSIVRTVTSMLAVLMLGLASGLTTISPFPTAIAQVEDTKEVLAVRVRQQGHQCDTPLKAERDAGESKAHLAVWVLQCTNANYRLRLHTDRDAEITKVN